MGQKHVSQGDGGGTSNPEREGDSEEDEEYAVQGTLADVSVEETESEAESLDDMGVSDRYQDAINDIEFSEDVDEDDAAKFKESLGKLCRDEDAGFTEAQLERVAVDGLDEDDDLSTDIGVQVWGGTRNIKAGEEQRVGLTKDVSQTQADVAALHLLTTANGMDTKDHAAGEKGRETFENDGADAAAPMSEEEIENRKLVVENENMSTEWMEEAAEEANALFESQAKGFSGVTERPPSLDGARSDSERSVANGREAFVLMASSLMKEDSTLGTNSFVNHGEKLKATSEAVGESSVGSQQKEQIQYFHERSQAVDGVDSPWDDSPYDVSYDFDDVTSNTFSNLFAGSGVDQERFFPHGSSEKPKTG